MNEELMYTNLEKNILSIRVGAYHACDITVLGAVGRVDGYHQSTAQWDLCH